MDNILRDVEVVLPSGNKGDLHYLKQEQLEKLPMGTRIWLVPTRDNNRMVAYYDIITSGSYPWSFTHSELAPFRIESYTIWGLLCKKGLSIGQKIVCPCDTCTGVLPKKPQKRFQLIDFSED